MPVCGRPRCPAIRCSPSHTTTSPGSALTQSIPPISHSLGSWTTATTTDPTATAFVDKRRGSVNSPTSSHRNRRQPPRWPQSSTTSVFLPPTTMSASPPPQAPDPTPSSTISVVGRTIGFQFHGVDSIPLISDSAASRLSLIRRKHLSHLYALEDDGFDFIPPNAEDTLAG